MERFFGQLNIFIMINIFKFPGRPLTLNLEFVLIEVIISLGGSDQLALVPVCLELGIIFKLSPLLLHSFADGLCGPLEFGCFDVARNGLVHSNALELVVEEVHYYFYEFLVIITDCILVFINLKILSN
tara:strand:+ start:252 stop:635 length:384 start_codon:yes stop_codon:yes gene_type:complete